MEQAPYGLYKGQYRRLCRVRNGIWFDQHWHMLGWGDLTDVELTRIAKEIPFGHLFIILSVPKVVPFIPSIEHCAWLIEHRCIYTIADEAGLMERRDGVRHHRVCRATAVGIIERIKRLNSQ